MASTGRGSEPEGRGTARTDERRRSEPEGRGAVCGAAVRGVARLIPSGVRACRGGSLGRAEGRRRWRLF